MRNRRRILGVAAAAILATLGTVALVGYVQSAKDEALAEERLVNVYVVDEAIPEGASAETIKASVSVEQVPARLEQQGAITDLDAVGDLVAGTDLLPGEQLLGARLVRDGEATDAVTDRVQVSALLTAERAVGGAIEEGDLVGVYLSFEPFEIQEAGHEAPESAIAAADPAAPDGSVPPAPDGDADEDKKTPNLTHLEFQHVLVTNVQTTSAPAVTSTDEDDDGEDGDDGDEGVTQVSGDQYIVTLALTPEQSERFVFATEFGHVWLANEPASVSDDGTRPVTWLDVFQVVQ